MTGSAAPSSSIGPAEVRHAVENFLAAYTGAVDDRDEAGITDLLARTAVSFDGAAAATGPDLVALYRRAFAAGAPTRHLVCVGRVDHRLGDREGQARYPYQRWSTAGPAPVIEVIGTYLLLVEVDGDGVRVHQMNVIRS